MRAAYGVYWLSDRAGERMLRDVMLCVRRGRRVALCSVLCVLCAKSFYHLSRRLKSYKAILYFEYTSPTRLAVT
jgi:hypothetical protein